VGARLQGRRARAQGAAAWPAHALRAREEPRSFEDVPLLDLDGHTYADSTDIIAALEERWPDPPLYPADPAERERALELEDFFDEEVGPHTRLYAWHEITRDREVAARLLANEVPGPLRPVAPYMAPVAGAFLQVRYGVKAEDAAAEARRKIAAGFDRLESELGDREYLVGDSFTVADLTAAALYYPTVLPAEGPAAAGSAAGIRRVPEDAGRSARVQVGRADLARAPQARRAEDGRKGVATSPRCPARP
jgi:glutathione S-transferase